MPRRVAIIQGHPDPAGGHFGHALADAYAEGALAAGHAVERIEVARLDFPLLRTQADFETGCPPDSIRAAQDALRRAEHWVLLYPLWLGAMPGLLKGFLEQVCRPGFAFRYAARGMPEKLMKGRSARIVVTMGMPAFAYRWWFGAHSLRSLERNILGFIGIRPIRETLIGGVGGLGAAKAAAWLERMRSHGCDAR
ncbi:dehydrogenase [Caldovatus sediminis]|uniref:Dehydrogenase n=1 Tax=Caldovatus sediminis TaxID=2041189 RepID=A0A8J3EEP3_9PROT|nr:NAD(P)H-dependent oxidoreductase [Caldovatus sediminis]GGG43411.1 dehydrogenase [Caldovatus sediminis]